jgi:hypothetical protein
MTTLPCRLKPRRRDLGSLDLGSAQLELVSHRFEGGNRRRSRTAKNTVAKQQIEESRVRKAGGWIADRLAALKLEIDDDAKGHLRRLERLEALAVGIDGKIALWCALDAAAPSNAELEGMDYGRLTQRGRDQRARVETLRVQAAREALAA